MAKFTWVVFTNCDPDHEDEFNEWYDTVHTDDLLRIPGIQSIKRSRRTDVQLQMVEDKVLMSDAETIGARYKYLACYFIETDDIAAVLKDVQSRSNTPQMVLSPYLLEAYTVMYEDMS